MKQKFTQTFLGLFFSFCLVTTFSFSQNQNEISVVKQYALQHKDKLKISPKDVESLFETYAYVEKSSGIQHIYATQKLNGLTVTNTNFSLHSIRNFQSDASRLISAAKYKILPVAVGITAKDAVNNVMNSVGYSANRNIDLKQAATGTDKYTIFKRNNSSIWDIPCRLVYYNNERLHTLMPAWEVQMMDAYKTHYWLVYINASTGEMLRKKILLFTVILVEV